MKRTLLRSSSLFLSCFAAAISFALVSGTAAKAATTVSIDLQGETIGNGDGVDLDSGANTLIAAKVYTYLLQGTIKGNGQLAPFVQQQSLAEFLEKLSPGSSATLSGKVVNSAGTLPFLAIPTRTYSGSSSTPFGTLQGSFTVRGKLSSTGQLRFVVNNVSFTLNGAPVAGNIEFVNGSATVAVPAVVQFKPAAYVVSESAGSVVLTVKRSGNLDSPVTVDYTTVEETATSPEDFTSVSGTLTIGEGVNQESIPVVIANNDAIDGSRRFKVKLSNPSNGVIFGVNKTAIVKIKDDDGL